jgi:hypothetical protein
MKGRGDHVTLYVRLNGATQDPYYRFHTKCGKPLVGRTCKRCKVRVAKSRITPECAVVANADGSLTVFAGDTVVGGYLAGAWLSWRKG